jgi:hypothetical protein
MLEQSPQMGYDPARAQEMARIAEQLTYQRRLKSGASNFYWVAILSIINSLVSIFGGGMYFVVGLGATLLVDALASAVAEELGGSSLVLAIGFVITLFLDAIIAGFGFLAARKYAWAFIIGMVLYALDALLMLVFQEWLGFAFHLLFLFGMWTGYQALRKLKSIDTAALTYAVPPAEMMR